MPSTNKNLQEAFAGESQANRKYTAFSRKAEEEGFPNVARLFRAAAEAETIHALGHFDAMEGIKSTEENLKAAVEGETYEYTEMYPPMLDKAKEEDHKAARMFKFAMETEKVHAEMYRKALELVKEGRDLDTDIYLCPVCGNLEFGKPDGDCPVCGLASERYELIR